MKNTFFFPQILVSCLILREILSILDNFFSGVLLYLYPHSPLEWPCLIIKPMNLYCQNRHKNSAQGCSNFVISTRTTSGPSSSCEMIILRNNSHGGIIRVCMGIFTTALRNKKIRQILNKNTSPYFHSVSLVIWPLTLMKRAHFSELFISRFLTYIRKAQGWTLHFRTPNPRSEKSMLKMTGRPQIQRRIQARIL